MSNRTFSNLRIKKIGLPILGFLILLFSIPSAYTQQIFYHLLPHAIAPYTWVGFGADANWTTAQNWSSGVVPGAANTAIFDENCTINCSATINASISVGGVLIKNTYSGTITQGAGNTVTIGSAGWTQSTGTFVGGNSQFTFTDSALTLSGTASFTATTGQTYFNSTVSHGTFDVLTLAATNTLSFPNGSTARFSIPANCGSPNYRIVSPVKVSFYDLTLGSSATGCGPATFGNSVATIEVRNDFFHTTATEPINYTGNFEVYGNFSSNAVNNSDAVFYALGAVSKTYEGPGGLTYLIVNKTGGATLTPKAGTVLFSLNGISIVSGGFTFPATLNISKRNMAPYEWFKIASGTTVTTPANSTVNLTAWGDCGSPVYPIDIDTTYSFENLAITSTSTGCGGAVLTKGVGDTIIVKKNFTPSTGVTYNFDLILEGNLLAGTGNLSGNMALTFQNTSAETAAMNTGFTTGNWTVNKASGNVTLQTNTVLTNAGQDLTITSGTVDMNGKNLTINDTLTIASAGKLICNGGTISAGTYVLVGEFSCGTSLGITWTGATGDHLWSTAGNWTNNNIPGASDIAVFNSKCTGANCDVTINTNVNVKGIKLQSTYVGTITQGTSTIAIGTTGWTQDAGTFTGGNGAMQIVNANFTLNGGTFTSTSGIFLIHQSNFTISGTPTFNHNSGTIKFDSSSAWTSTITPGTLNFYNVFFRGDGLTANFGGGTMNVTGTLTLADIYGGKINSGTLLATGNVETQNAGYSGTGLLKVAGSTNQTITGVNTAYFPHFELASTGGTVSLVGTLKLNGNYTYTSGSLNSGTATLTFRCPDASSASIIPGNINYGNVTFTGYAGTYNLNASTMNISGTLTIGDTYSSVHNINNGTILAKGDVVANNYGETGTAILRIAGNANQAITGTATSWFPAFEIVSTGGTVSFAGTLLFSGNFTYTSGVVSAGTSTVYFKGPDASSSTVIIPGTVAYNNVTFAGYSTSYSFANGSMTINGTLTLADTYSGGHNLTNGTLLAYGNVTNASYGYSGTAWVKVVGSTNQTITGSSTTSQFPYFEIASTGGTVTISGTPYFTGSFKMTSGNVVATGSTMIFRGPDNQTTSIIPGTATYDNVTFLGNAGAFNLNSGTMTVNGTLTLSDTYSGNRFIDSGTFNVSGNVVATNNGKTGTAVLNLVGSTSSTLSVATTANLLSTTTVVNKSGGATITMIGDTNIGIAGQSLNITGGVLDLSGYDLTVNNVITVGTGTTLRCNGGDFTSTTLTNNGTIDCAGFATYSYNWTGAGGNSNWNTAANWSGNVVPGSSDVAGFANTFCGANCNATINVDPNVRGVKVLAPYTGVITQGAGVVVTLGASGWKQAAGTFTGNNANFRTKNLKLTGGTFTAPTATLTTGYNVVNGSDVVVFDYQGGTFAHNNGTVELYSMRPGCFTGGSTLRTINTTGALNFNNLTITSDVDSCYWVFSNYTSTGAGSINVLGNLVHDGGYYNITNINVAGNYSYTARTAQNAGSAGTVTLNGTGAQTYNGTDPGIGPKLVINKTAGAVTTTSTNINLVSLDVTQGTFTAPTGLLKLGFTQTSGQTLALLNKGASGTFNHNNGNIQFYSNFIVCSTSASETISTNGTLTLNNLNLTSIADPCWGGNTNFTVSSGTLSIAGDLTYNGGLINGNWNVAGNFSATSSTGAGGTGALTFSGTTNKSITISAGSLPTGTVTVNKTAGSKISSASNATFNGATQDLVITAGTLDMAGFNLTIGRNITNSGTLQKGNNPSCGTLSYGGTYSGTAAICP